jgi:itaconate CoA-transferase
LNPPPQTLPLTGITVVSLEHAIAAPFASRQLADLGARVIKVERPCDGDFARRYDTRVSGLASHFVWVNRSKESLTLDLKNELAMSALQKLLEKADVLIQNLAPGAASRMGLSGYGADGPDRDRKAYDLLIQSEAGFLSITGTPQSPSKAGCSIADIAAGMYAFSSIQSALLLRQKTGQGSGIDVSMLESLAEWMGYPLYYSYKEAPPPERAGASHSTIFPYGPFKAGDGRSVMLGLQNDREWVVFCEKVLEDVDLVGDERFKNNALRSENRQELSALIEASFSRLSASEVASKLDAADIANANMNDMRDLWNHEQLKARDRWVSVETPVGQVPALKPPGRSTAFEPRMEGIPEVGAHTNAILNELSFDTPTIERLRAAKAI